MVAGALRVAVAGRQVLEDVSLRVRPHEVVALVGSNGAGETILLHVLLGLLRADGGSVERGPGLRRVGVAFDSLALPRTGTVDDALRCLARYLVPPDRCQDEVAASLAGGLLAPIRGRPVLRLSNGGRQRLSLAAALLGEPELVVLDEPHDALDTLAVVELGRLLRERADRGAGVLLTSHHIAEVEGLCDRVVVLHGGRVVLDEEVATLRRVTGYRLTCDDPVTALALLAAHGVGARLAQEHGELRLQVHEPGEAARALRLVVEAGVEVTGLEPLRRRLADVVADHLGPGGRPERRS